MLTPIGRMLAQLPVDVVIGKMLIMASLFEVSFLTTILSIFAEKKTNRSFYFRLSRWWIQS